MAYSSRKPQIHNLRKFEYYMQSIKQGLYIEQYQTSEKYKHAYVLSTCFGPFCSNYCLNAVLHGSYQPVALLRCYGRPGCFNSGLQLFCIVRSHVSSFSWRFSMGFRSGEFAGQSSTVIPRSLNQVLVLLAMWAGAKSCWKMKSASP